MKQGHLATAAFWIGLLTLFGWQASADRYCARIQSTPTISTTPPYRGRPHATDRAPAAVRTNPDPAAPPARSRTPNTREDARIARLALPPPNSIIPTRAN